MMPSPHPNLNSQRLSWHRHPGARLHVGVGPVLGFAEYDPQRVRVRVPRADGYPDDVLTARLDLGFAADVGDRVRVVERCTVERGWDSFSPYRGPLYAEAVEAAT